MSDEIRVLADCPLGTGLRVARLFADEAIDHPYEIVADIVVEGEPPELSAVLGADASIDVVRGASSRRLVGLVRSVRDLGRYGDFEATLLRLEIRPAMALLALRRNTRMFQEKTAPEILEAVLGEALSPYGRSVTLELRGEYARREYCLQYQESDLEFVQRIMQEEGIAYCFDHAGGVEQLLLRDSNDAYARAEGCDATLSYHPDVRVVRDEQAVHTFEHARRLTGTHVTARDWDFSTQGFLVEAAVGAADERGKSRESYEHGWGRSVSIWDYDGQRYASRDAQQRVQVRLEQHQRDALVGRGTASVMGLVPGATFELAGHPTPGLDGEYLLTRVRRVHGGGSADAAAPGAGAPDLIAHFECIPLDVPYRPLRTARKPAIESVQTAVVTGPPGEEIHTDVHGRVKVQFHWDRENPTDDTSSCWVRVQQKWAGTGWGFWWLPRVGMEVVVHFVDGDPDRPLVTGSVYDAKNPLPYPLPDEKTKSTIKSNSSPGGGGYNELRFEDKSGSEQIFVHAQKDYNEVVLHDHTTLVHNDQSNEVDGNQTQTVHNNQSERVDANQDLSVGGNRTVHVEGNFDETVDGTETRTVTGAVTESFGANETRTIAADVTEDIGAAEQRDVGGSQTETIMGSRTQQIGASSSVTISGALAQTIGGGITLDVGAAWNVTSTGGYTAIVPGGFQLDAPGGFRVGAPGGVTQVDSFREIIAQTIGSKGVFQRAVAGAKFGVGAANFCFVGSAGGADGSVIKIGLHIQNKGGIMEKAGPYLIPGGLDVGAGPSSDD